MASDEEYEMSRRKADLLQLGRRQLVKEGLLHTKFRLTEFVEDYRTGKFIAMIDYIPEGGGQCSTISVEIEREELETCREQLLDVMRFRIQCANQDLIDFIRMVPSWAEQPK